MAASGLDNGVVERWRAVGAEAVDKARPDPNWSVISAASVVPRKPVRRLKPGLARSAPLAVGGGSA
jgi:hypothetical protein